MKLEKTWKAIPEIIENRYELANMAGQRNVGVKVYISTPFIYTSGPITKKTLE